MAESLVIYCADIGSTKVNFGWARIDSAGREKARGSSDIASLPEEVASDLTEGRLVALGFECPLWVPVPIDSASLGKARPGECVDGTNRPWSGGPGSAVLTTGLAQVPWILRELRGRVSDMSAYLDWSAFTQAGRGIFLWEAFVTGSAKGDSHEDDAQIGAEAFREALPDPRGANVSKMTEPVFSLVGGAMVETGWARDRRLLGSPSIVIKAR